MRVYRDYPSTAIGVEDTLTVAINAYDVLPKRGVTPIGRPLVKVQFVRLGQEMIPFHVQAVFDLP